MHPSPVALMTMTSAELETYREELSRLSIEANEDVITGVYRARYNLVDAILADRKAQARSTVVL